MLVATSSPINSAGVASRLELFRAAVVIGPGAGLVVSGGAARGSPSTVHRIAGGRSIERSKVPFALHACCAVNAPSVESVAISRDRGFGDFSVGPTRLVMLKSDGVYVGPPPPP